MLFAASLWFDIISSAGEACLTCLFGYPYPSDLPFSLPLPPSLCWICHGISISWECCGAGGEEGAKMHRKGTRTGNCGVDWGVQCPCIQSRAGGPDCWYSYEPVWILPHPQSCEGCHKALLNHLWLMEQPSQNTLLPCVGRKILVLQKRAAVSEMHLQDPTQTNLHFPAN